MPRLRPLLLLVLALALLTLPGEARAAAGACRGADLVPATGNLAQVRAAVLCLHNRTRAERGLRPLREHRRLRRAARGHAVAMVRQRFFAHVTPSGTTLTTRLKRARYIRPRRGFSVGENLAWGAGGSSTARSAHARWLASPAHRATILDRRYREIGIAIAVGTPTGAAGATFAADFGAR